MLLTSSIPSRRPGFLRYVPIDSSSGCVLFCICVISKHGYSVTGSFVKMKSPLKIYLCPKTYKRKVIDAVAAKPPWHVLSFWTWLSSRSDGRKYAWNHGEFSISMHETLPTPIAQWEQRTLHTFFAQNDASYGRWENSHFGQYLLTDPNSWSWSRSEMGHFISQEWMVAGNNFVGEKKPIIIVVVIKFYLMAVSYEGEITNQGNKETHSHNYFQMHSRCLWIMPMIIRHDVSFACSVWEHTLARRYESRSCWFQGVHIDGSVAGCLTS